MDRIGDWADEASRRVTVTLVHGPWEIKSNSQVTLNFQDSGLAVSAGIIDKKQFFIPYDAIIGMTIDTAERMTLSRVLLVGIFAFGMKKKDKFLKLDFRDDTGIDAAAVFGKGPLCDAQTLHGRISQARHDFRAACPEAIVVDDGALSSTTDDVAATIEKLAQLRNKGMISEEEFQQKKAELLSRL